MTKLLLKIFVKDYANTQSDKVRKNYGVLSSVVSIICNILLALSKILLGLFTGLISIMADGLNNLTDCGSNVVSMVSFQLSNKPADKEHPFGHQRIEYISSTIVAFIILLIGVQLAIESFNSILNPVLTPFSYVTVAVLGLSIITKLWMFFFNGSLAKAINSTLLKSTAQDSLNDVWSTIAVLIAVIVSALTDVSIDGYVGMVVAVIILLSGFNILRDTLSHLVGQAPSEELVESITEQVKNYPAVYNVHDIVVHSYGANVYFASTHIEVDSEMTVQQGHDIADRIEKDFAELGINMVVHIDPISRSNLQYESYYNVVSEAIATLNKHYHVQDFRMVKSATTYNLVFEISVPVDHKHTDDEIVAFVNDRTHQFDDQATLVIDIVHALH